MFVLKDLSIITFLTEPYQGKFVRTTKRRRNRLYRVTVRNKISAREWHLIYPPWADPEWGGPYRISQFSPLAKRKKTQYEDMAQIKHDVQVAGGPLFHLQHLFIPGALDELANDRSVRVVALGELLELQVW